MLRIRNSSIIGDQDTDNKTNSLSIDDLDLELLNLLARGNDNKQISAIVNVPLSTIQRRTRKLFEKGLVHSSIKVDYNKMGFRKGLIDINLSNCSIDKIGQQIANTKGITDVSVHIGNSDLVCTCICQSTNDLMRLLLEIRSIQGVGRAEWSEEVYSIGSDSQTNYVNTTLN
ncbi:MAG TPA: Lrp/AsnC family transcriptional regulator [Nitrososphaeraceae archaeon]